MRNESSLDSKWSWIARRITRRSPFMHMILSGGSWSGGETNHLFVNKQAEQFEELSGVSGMDDPADARAYVVWDFDHDGWQDIAVVNRNNPRLRLYRNQIGDFDTNDLQMFAVRFVGSARSGDAGPGKSNRDGYGTRVWTTIGGQTQTRDQLCGQGFASQNSQTMIIGLGTQTKADELKVRWPSGKLLSKTDIPAKSLVTVYEDAAQSPTGDHFVMEAYEPAIRNDEYQIGPDEDAPRLAIHAQSQDSEAPKLRMYETMATWCAVCNAKLPALEQLRARFAPGELGLYGVPIDEDEGPETLKAWAERRLPAYELLSELPQEQVAHVKQIVHDHFKTDLMPATIVTDTAGKVLHIQTGHPSVSKLRELLDRVSKQPSGG